MLSVEQRDVAAAFGLALTQPVAGNERRRELRELCVRARWNLDMSELCTVDQSARAEYIAQADVLLAQLQEAL